jgi:hypothetical protein
MRTSGRATLIQSSNVTMPAASSKIRDATEVHETNVMAIMVRRAYRGQVECRV